MKAMEMFTKLAITAQSAVGFPSLRRTIRTSILAGALSLLSGPSGLAGERWRATGDDSLNDVSGCDDLGCDSFGWDDSDPVISRHLFRGRTRDLRFRTPEMIGSFFSGSPLAFRGEYGLDRLLVLADDLDVPGTLPGAGNALIINEPGPVGIFASSLQSVQQLQGLLRSGAPIPSATLAGIISDDATLSTALTINELQTLLASASLPYEIVPIAPPPGSYDTGVATAFQSRNSLNGVTVYDPSGSGALIQGGVNQISGGEDLDAFYFYDYVIRFNTALADASSGGIGRLKVAEGGAVLPQSRVYMRYGHFAGVDYTNRQALNRFTPGFEWAFGDGLYSLEIRAPFATDARTGSMIGGDGIEAGRNTRFGNLSLYMKALLYSDSNFAVSGGLGVILPTASDVSVDLADGTSLLKIDNDAVHLQPFLGFLYTPSSRWFAQGFVQQDISVAGNSVHVNADGQGLQRIGSLTDPNHLFLDLGVGCWAYRSDRQQGLTGVIPMVELHHVNGLGRGDSMSVGALQVGDFRSTQSWTSFAAGTTFEFGQATRLTTAYSMPFNGAAGRPYNGALQISLSRSL